MTKQKNDEVLKTFIVTDCYVTFVNDAFLFLNDHIAHVQNTRQDTKYVHLTDIINTWTHSQMIIMYFHTNTLHVYYK